jgi:predicted negative regulator of RcsB-dependent stress response
MLSLLATTLLALLPQSQNELVLVDGTTLQVDKILSETFTEVTYRRGKSEGRKPSDQVVEVRHNIGKSVLEDYAYAVEVMESGQFGNAVVNFRMVLEDEKLLNRAGYEWVRQHALFRQVRCMNSLADFSGVSATVDKLLAEVPNTFFYAPALMMKAQTKMDSGDKAGATKVFKRLQNEVVSKGLPQRWSREAELGLMLLDSSLSGSKLERALQGLVEKNASQYPTVAARARVEVGNAMVSNKDYDGARVFFKAIIKEGKGGDSVMAGAISGKGDCAYRQALSMDSMKDQMPYLEEAVLDFLTVASVYREEVRLVPRAMYFAGDALKRVGDSGGARAVATRLRQLFPDSSWKSKLFSELGLKG